MLSMRRCTLLVTRRYASSMNINEAVDKAHEAKSFTEILTLPPSALQGVAERSDPFFASIKIKTVDDLGKWKYFKAAKLISILAAKEQAGKRHEGSQLNLDKILDKEYETKSLNDILNAPPSALSGLTSKHDAVLLDLKISTIGDIANWKYAELAGAIRDAAKYETSASLLTTKKQLSGYDPK